MGLQHDRGGVKHNYQQAYEWFQKSADAKSTCAEFFLGLIHEKAQGVPQDFTKAMEFWIPLAQSSDTPSKIAIGDLYRNGNGVPLGSHLNTRMVSKGRS